VKFFKISSPTIVVIPIRLFCHSFFSFPEGKQFSHIVGP
jgi:hypothetical protein